MPPGRFLAGHHGVQTRAHVIARTALVWIVVVVVATARARVLAHALCIQAHLAWCTLDSASPTVHGVGPNIDLAPVSKNLVAVRVVYLAFLHVASARYAREHHERRSDRTRGQRLSHGTVVSTLSAVPVILVDVRAIGTAHDERRIARSLGASRLTAIVAWRARVTTELTVLVRTQGRLTAVFHVSIAIGICDVRTSHLAAPVEACPICAVELAAHPRTGRACVPARAAVEWIVVETRLAEMARGRARGVRRGALIARTHRQFSGSRRAVCACVRGILEAGGRPVRFVGVCPERSSGRGTRAIPENS